MKKNELVPVGNGESFTRCGWIRLALKTLFEDPHASFFVETIPLCVQLNLIVLLRLAIVGAFSLEIPRLFAVILGLFITTLIYSTSVAAKLWFLSPTRLQKIGVVIILCGGLFTQMKMVLFAPNIQTSIINKLLQWLWFPLLVLTAVVVTINGGLSSLPPLSGYSALLPPAALLFNIVLHELSHAWAGSSFGIPADAFGVGVYRFLPCGAAFFSLLPYATVSADVGISVAGPLANLFAGSVALLLAISSQSSDSLYLAVCSYTLGCINLLPIPGFDGVSLHDMFPHQLKIGFGTVLCGLAANWAVLAVGYALCFLPWWVSFLIVLVLTVMAALLLPSRHSVCWARMLSTFCLLPVMIKSLGFELLAVSLPTAILNIGFCLLLSYLTAPVLLELIFVSYLYQK